jgi:hypothetical protein
VGAVERHVGARARVADDGSVLVASRACCSALHNAAEVLSMELSRPS